MAAGAAPRPNILLLLVDTLRADALGSYGNEVIETPVIDQLATEGMLFERAFAPSTWTRAALASILTGLEAPGHGAETRDDALGRQSNNHVTNLERTGLDDHRHELGRHAFVRRFEGHRTGSRGDES